MSHSLLEWKNEGKEERGREGGRIDGQERERKKNSMCYYVILICYANICYAVIKNKFIKIKN